MINRVEKKLREPAVVGAARRTFPSAVIEFQMMRVRLAISDRTEKDEGDEREEGD